MGLQDTPSADRLHIGFFGRCNSGKSSLVNAFTGQQVAIVSPVAGTTTDQVYKAMELHGVGAVTLIDTAGIDDDGELGKVRIERTEKALARTDIAVLLFFQMEMEPELEFMERIKKRGTPCLPVVSKGDTDTAADVAAEVERRLGEKPIVVSTGDAESIELLRRRIVRLVPEDWGARSITGDLCREGDTVLLVMPQDIQAPKGRLILPQVQTIRDLLDKKCVIVSVTTDKLEEGLSALKKPPKLIITDSQVFKKVYDKKPPESLLTSFSVLFAGYKGDISRYLAGAEAIGKLTGDSRVLIAECCTHAPLAEDIGRVKIPRMLRSRYGESMRVDVVSGTDYPEDLSVYDLIIQCGGCMFNRAYVMSRIDRASDQQVPITNYGVAIAYLSGILDNISV